MKKRHLILAAFLFVFGFTAPARAQGTKQGPDVVRDADMEKDSLHNLEVAWQYFKLRKAYVAALQRCEEIIAGNPTFSKIDKVLYIAGKSNLYLSEGKGKQKPNLYKRTGANLQSVNLTSEEFRAQARAYFSQLIESYPDSQFKDEALDELKSLGGLMPKDIKK
jgi:outer membrane protein assembly factor BamD (BamD/ComL family)